jgi:hypothetical protein
MDTEIKSIESTQAETDSRVVLYCFYGKQQGEIIRAPNTTKKFNQLLFVFSIGKEGLPVWWLFRIFTSNNQFFTAIHELFFIVSMENNKDTEILEFVFRMPIYSLSSFTTHWNYKE